MQMLVVVIASGLLAVVAYGDVRTRRIPNGLCLGIAVLGAFRLVFAGDLGAACQTLAAAAGIFGAASLLFWGGAVGGGDAKLTAAMALLVGHREVLGFVFLMSLCGGVLALAILLIEALRGRLDRRRQSAGDWPQAAVAVDAAGLPYGVAIAAAGVVTLVLAQ